MDEEETRIEGNYKTYAEALAAAKDIVEKYIAGEYADSRDMNGLLGNYKMYGKDPIIISDDAPLPETRFSAWTYAEEYVNRMKGKEQKQS